MIKQTLRSSWKFHNPNNGKWYDATVPGFIQTDLLSNNIIPDPFFRLNESDVQWIMEKQWTYRTFFSPKKEILDKNNKTLYFYGIDTFSDIFLNDELIISTNNMFHPWEKDVSKYLYSGLNELKVIFHSPIKKVLPLMDKIKHSLPAENDQAGKTSPFSRKAPYHYGWDWGPCLVTSGIWKNVQLHGWDSFNLNKCSILNVGVEKKCATLFLEVEVFSIKKESATISIEESKSNTSLQIPIEIEKGKNVIDKKLLITDPDLWWPSGHGEQPLYTFIITITSATDSFTFLKRIGIRDIFIKREKDKKGRSFEVHVNGKPIFSKGANWIPADSFTTRIKKEHYKQLLSAAKDANMNMLRVWGGGIYEPEIFYDLCDEMGIMVWQDFMFACSMYPADQKFLESVKEEAQYQVDRLKSHPSIVLWCGNNEIASGWLSWGWKEELPASVWNDYKKIFHEVLPNVCKELDPGRLYWPSSPGHSISLPESDQRYGSGDNHYWGVWHGGDGFEAFEEYVGRFMSEYGMQSFPEMKTVRKFAEDRDLDIESKVMVSRQKASLGTGNLIKYIKDYFNPIPGFKATVILSQVMQALAIKTAVEAHRRNMPFCMGTLYWQFNDCWPAISWSSVDYYGNWKALHYYAKRFFNPLIVTIHENKRDLEIHVINDQYKEYNSKLIFQVSKFDGSVIEEKSFNLKIEKASSNCVQTLDKQNLIQGHDKSELFMQAEIRLKKELVCSDIYFFVKPKYLKLNKPKYKYKVERKEGTISIEIEAFSFIYQLHILCENADGIFSDNFFDLLAGEKTIIYFYPKGEDIKTDFNFRLNTVQDITIKQVE